MPLTDSEKAEIHKTLKKINRKLFTEEAILSITTTIEQILLGNIKLSDWFIEEVMDYTDWAYQFRVNKFVKLDST